MYGTHHNIQSANSIPFINPLFIFYLFVAANINIINLCSNIPTNKKNIFLMDNRWREQSWHKKNPSAIHITKGYIVCFVAFLSFYLRAQVTTCLKFRKQLNFLVDKSSRNKLTRLMRGKTDKLHLVSCASLLEVKPRSLVNRDLVHYMLNLRNMNYLLYFNN